MHIRQGVYCKLLKKRKIWKKLKNEKERKRDKEKEKKIFSKVRQEEYTTSVL